MRKRDFCCARETFATELHKRDFWPESCRENFSRGVALINDFAAVGQYYSLKCNSVRKMFFLPETCAKEFLLLEGLTRESYAFVSMILACL